MGVGTAAGLVVAPVAVISELWVVVVIVESDERVYCLSKAEASRERRI